MEFSAFDAARRLLLRRVYYSIGGGFVVNEAELAAPAVQGKKPAGASGVPYPFATAAEMLAMATPLRPVDRRR